MKFTPSRHPHLFFAVVGLVAAIVGGVSLSFISPLSLPLNLLIGINLGSFLLCGYDKSVAIASRDDDAPKRTRVPVRVLCLMAFIGGSVGLILGMKLFRHKTSAPEFQFWLVLIILVQALLIRWGVSSFDLSFFGDEMRSGSYRSLKEKLIDGEPLF